MIYANKKGKKIKNLLPPTIKHKDSFYFLATESFVATTAESFEMVSFTATLSFAAVESDAVVSAIATESVSATALESYELECTQQTIAIQTTATTIIKFTRAL